MLNAVSVTIIAAVTSPYSAGTRKRASTKVPTMPTTREVRLVDSVQAAPRTVRAVRLDVTAVGDSVMAAVGAERTAAVATLSSPMARRRRAAPPHVAKTSCASRRGAEIVGARHEDRGHWLWIRRARRRRRVLGFRQPRHLRRYRSGTDRAAAARRDSVSRARAVGSGAAQCEAGPARVHDRHGRGGARLRGRVPRGRYALAARRLGESRLRRRGGPRRWPRADRAHGAC